DRAVSFSSGRTGTGRGRARAVRTRRRRGPGSGEAAGRGGRGRAETLGGAGPGAAEGAVPTRTRRGPARRGGGPAACGPGRCGHGPGTAAIARRRTQRGGGREGTRRGAVDGDRGRTGVNPPTRPAGRAGRCPMVPAAATRG